MTAEPSVQDRAAEVLRGHAAVSQPFAPSPEFYCAGCDNNGPGTPEAHQADVLAAAGLLAGEAA